MIAAQIAEILHACGTVRGSSRESSTALFHRPRLSAHTIRATVLKGKFHPVRICRGLLFSSHEIARILASAG